MGQVGPYAMPDRRPKDPDRLSMPKLSLSRADPGTSGLATDLRDGRPQGSRSEAGLGSRVRYSPQSDLD